MFAGETHRRRVLPTKFRFMGFQRAPASDYGAALSPNMLQLAGEVADA